MTEPLHTTRFPGESEEYRRARDELLQAEVELRRHTEAVAAKRRALPLGGVVPEDYCFEEVADGGGEVRFSELLQAGKDTLVVYSFMFPRSPGDTRPGPAGETGKLALAETPCASCTSILDSLDGAAHPPRSAAQPRRGREVRSGRIRTSRASAGGETCDSSPLRTTTTTATTKPKPPEGNQLPILNVFVRRRRGASSHMGHRARCSPRATKARTRGTSTPSGRSGTCST